MFTSSRGEYLEEEHANWVFPLMTQISAVLGQSMGPLWHTGLRDHFFKNSVFMYMCSLCVRLRGEWKCQFPQGLEMEAVDSCTNAGTRN